MDRHQWPTRVGPTVLRYHVIDMPDRMDVELGIPVNEAPATDGRLTSSELPAGRYAILTYQGVKNGVSANKKLIDWIAKHKEQTVSHSSDTGVAFKARFETFLTDARKESDKDKWETEISIKLRD